MSKPSYSSSTAEKFVVRLPEGMRKAIENLADENFSSMNSEIIRAIEAHLQGQARQKLLLDALQAQVDAGRPPAREQLHHQAEKGLADSLKTGTC